MHTGWGWQILLWKSQRNILIQKINHKSTLQRSRPKKIPQNYRINTSPLPPPAPGNKEKLQKRCENYSKIAIFAPFVISPFCWEAGSGEGICIWGILYPARGGGDLTSTSLQPLPHIQQFSSGAWIWGQAFYQTQVLTRVKRYFWVALTTLGNRTRLAKDGRKEYQNGAKGDLGPPRGPL